MAFEFRDIDLHPDGTGQERESAVVRHRGNELVGERHDSIHGKLICDDHAAAGLL
jgi:hypothetical protein